MKIIGMGKGINAHIINTDKFKTITVCMLLRRPLLRNEATINAIIPGVVSRGCMKYDSIEKINCKLDEMYGAVFHGGVVKKGEEQILQYYLDLADIKNEPFLLRDGLQFMRDIVYEPLVENDAFIEKIVKREIENLRDDIEGRTNNRGEYAKLRCIEEMCREEPFGVYADGYISDLGNLNHEKVYWQYKRILNESPIEFIVIGNVEEDRTMHYLKESFSLHREKIIKIPNLSNKYEKKEPNFIKEEMDVTQGKICIGIRSGVEAGSANFYSLMLLNEMLGGGPGSKLFTNVREKESLCYYISSFVYRFKGILFVQAGADTENLIKIYRILEEEIRKIADGNFSRKDFDNAKSGLIKKYRGAKDYPSSMLDFYTSQYMIGDSSDLDEFIENFNRVKLEDLPSMAQRLYVDTVYTLEGKK